MLSRPSDLSVSLKIKWFYRPGQATPGLVNTIDFGADRHNKWKLWGFRACVKSEVGRWLGVVRFSDFSRESDSIFLCEISQLIALVN